MSLHIGAVILMLWMTTHILGPQAVPIANKWKSNDNVRRIPEEDGLLHFYALPVGQGDSHVIQCPNGDLAIVDLGTSEDETAGFWHVPEIKSFLSGKFNRISSVVLTHNHFDHYSFLEEVLDVSEDISGLSDIYISCNFDDMVSSIQTWITDINAEGKLRPFNGGSPCGHQGPACEPMNLCPNDPNIRVVVMSANAGQQCSAGNKNIDSVVFKIAYNNVSIMFNGDFEDFTSSWGEDGPQKSMTDYYGSEMQVTVYKLSHHGASYLANKPVTRDAVLPKAVFVSSNPWYDYGHPRCTVTDAFINYVGTLCKPSATSPSDPYYCGEHVIPGLPLENTEQRLFTCGESSTETRTVTDNDYAIYSTVPDNFTLNLLKFSTDGSRWGFTTSFMPRK